jgi:hypothetical protein
MSPTIKAHNGAARPSCTVVDSEKLLAAKKRREELIEKKVQSAKGGSGGGGRGGPRSWKQRLKLIGTVSVSSLLILSCASLLFTCLIVVDPIIVGLRARFSPEPGLCR